MPTLENYPRNPNDQLPAFLVNQLQEMLSSSAPNLVLSSPTPGSLRVAAGSGNSGRLGATVKGLWRYTDVDLDVAHPGGAAGIYNVWLVVSANSISGSYVDNTDYAIYPQILAQGAVPTGNTPANKPIAASRLVGQCEWDGSEITGYWTFVGTRDSTQPSRPMAPNSKAWALKVLANASQAAGTVFATFQNGNTHVLDLQTAAAVFGVPVTINGALTHNGDLVLGDGHNLVLGTGTGSEIGTSANQKLSFWGATPVARVPAPAQAPVNSETNQTGGFPAALSAGSTLGDVIATLSRVVSVLQEYGLLGTGGWNA